MAGDESQVDEQSRHEEDDEEIINKRTRKPTFYNASNYVRRDNIIKNQEKVEMYEVSILGTELIKEGKGKASYTVS